MAGYAITGHLQLNDHCEFPWSETEYSSLRTVEIRDHHCAACIEALRGVAAEKSYRVYDQRSPRARSLSPATEPPLCQSILVIDDEVELLESVRALLVSAGYQVLTAHDAREGLTRLGSLGQRCLVLLDLEMPGMSGWEFLEARSHDPGFSRLPVVLLTGREPHGAAQAATAYLRKPIDGNALRKLVEQYCGPRIH